jgi:Flp pilus assembly protein TadG
LTPISTRKRQSIDASAENSIHETTRLVRNSDMVLQNMRRRRFPVQRRGTITVLAAAMSIVALGMVAFAVDVGYILASKQELQRTADSTAMAACWKYMEELALGSAPVDAVEEGRSAAAQYAHNNPVARVQPAIDQNVANAANGDLVFGGVNDLYSYDGSMDTSNANEFNVVRVKIRRDSTLNGETSLFFGNVFGEASLGLDAQATAGFFRRISGFKAPASGENLDVLPYALDWETWQTVLNNSAADNWCWNPSTKTCTAGSDGVLEVNLFPQGTGSPGNRGTVDIGSANNSTADIARQIVYGISPSDLAYHGGSLEFNDCGEIELNGDTGISAGVKDELTSIKGKPRLIPIFSQVVGPGNNAQYTIVHWAGIRIMDVKLTGAMNQKRVIVQPAHMVLPGAIASTEETSDFVYSPVVLVQ